MSLPFLIVPAAGLGTRLRSTGPKLLQPIQGKPMIDHLLDLYEPTVAGIVLVLHPTFEAAVRRHCEPRGSKIFYVTQTHPTGMLDAVLAPSETVREADPSRIWITWCDQVAIHPDTVQTLKHETDREPVLDLVFPTAQQRDPYIHIEREPGGRIIEIRQRREGDQMPEVGESDMGLFSLSSRTYLTQLAAYAADAQVGSTSQERNFLPFIPWVAARSATVRTFPCRDPREAIGVNTPDDLRIVEGYLSERNASAARG